MITRQSFHLDPKKRTIPVPVGLAGKCMYTNVNVYKERPVAGLYQNCI